MKIADEVKDRGYDKPDDAPNAADKIASVASRSLNPLFHMSQAQRQIICPVIDASLNLPPDILLRGEFGLNLLISRVAKQRHDDDDCDEHGDRQQWTPRYGILCGDNFPFDEG